MDYWVEALFDGIISEHKKDQREKNCSTREERKKLNSTRHSSKNKDLVALSLAPILLT